MSAAITQARAMSWGDEEFMQGVALAAAMLERGRAVAADPSSIEAQYRDGAPMDNFALDYLVRASMNVFRLRGFAAVLSDGLSGSMADPDVYRALTHADIVGAAG